jgi:ribose-phosphate pyrophosphokinase
MHVMTMMLHSPQVHGFFSVPTDPLSSRPVLKQHFQQRDLSSTIVVATDMGHAKSAARFAKDLGLPVAAGDKGRYKRLPLLRGELQRDSAGARGADAAMRENMQTYIATRAIKL